MAEPLYYASIRGISDRLRARQISPVEILDVCLARIAALNPRLNAFATIMADEAREDAQKAEAEIKAGGWRGALHGIPMGIKDFYDVANVKTTAAFEKFKDRVPARDAAAVTKLKHAGAIVVGKMNMHQLGMGTTGLDSHFGPVRNPWNDAYIPGGSSSGSAAAVAAGLCYATLDTDAIGSCRLPAACCGVVGFKGTFGLIDAKGILEGERADEAILLLSHPAITTRITDDTIAVLNALAAPNESPEIFNDQDGAPHKNPLRVGIADNFSADTEIAHAFQAALETIRMLTHQLLRATAPFDMPPFGDVRTIAADRTTISERTFKDIDVLLLPTTVTTVLSVADASGNPQALSSANTQFANYFGLPAVSVPCGFDQRGLPIGVQIVGKPWTDRTVLRLAREYETRMPSPKTHPIP